MSKTNILQVEYNSIKEPLILPEYGRNIYLMVQYAKSVADKEERAAYINSIVELMYQMAPQNKNVEDIKTRLWNHIYEIADYDLDVMPPNGIVPTPAGKKHIPERIGYPKSESKLRHYGNNVKRLINKALEMEDEVKRDGMVHCIGAYMKLAFRTWNREHFVTDEVIKSDIKTLSDGKLSLEEDAVIENLKPAITNRRNINSNNNNQKRKGQNNRPGYGNNNNRNNRNNSNSSNSNSGAGRSRWRNNRPNQ